LGNGYRKFQRKIYWPPLAACQGSEPIPPERDGSSAATLENHLNVFENFIKPIFIRLIKFGTPIENSLFDYLNREIIK
jgi:hypothetical protein